MFGRISEQAIRIVRWALVGGWLLIIASLLYDPLSARLTDAGAAFSPFRLNRAASAPLAADRYRCPLTNDGGARVDWAGLPAGTCDPRCPRIQGRCLIQRPYAIGARVFWTMILPLVPLFLMVFGHEAWRRICPLSALAQIPRALGLQRREKFTDPRSGKVESRVRLVKAGSFLARYFWFVQFGLLWLGLSSRLLFINSDRVSLAVFFIGVIVFAMTVGVLFGGKTWCHTLCPISPVQKFYTEPRGLFESKAHVAPASGANVGLTQSSCRRVDAHGKEQSACVGCRAPCPDIDLERQYWKDLQTAGRRFFYYGYLGLVVGFYSYYRLYAGNWEYYFTGAWTHEVSQRATLWSPGWFIAGRAIPVPKLVAAPVTLAVFILGAYACGRLVERIYRMWREGAGRPLPIAELRHRVFAIFTFATFNAFYGFAGRPNIALFPPIARTAIDMMFVVVSTTWLITRFLRNVDEYERESIEGSLRRQLVQLRLDTPRLFHGRSLSHLRTDEVYALGRVLPDLTANQSRVAYREVLQDALASGHTRSAAARNVLRSLRRQLGVSEEEHALAAAEMGLEDQGALDPDDASLQERRLRIDGYRGEIEALLSPFLENGTALQEALRRPSIQARVTTLQGLYSIDEAEHEEVSQALLGSGGALIRRARDVTRGLVRLERMRDALTRVGGDGEPLARLLLLSLDRREERLVSRVVAHLAALGDSEESRAIGKLLGQSRSAALAVLKQSVPLPAALGAAIEGAAETTAAAGPTATAAAAAAADGVAQAVAQAVAGQGSGPLDAEMPLELALTEIATSWEPLARRLARALAPDLDVAGAAPLAGGGADGRGGGDEDPALLGRMGQLGGSPLFDHLSLENIAQLARVSTAREYAAGELICARGAPGDGVLLVVRGSAHVLIETEDGTRKGLVEAGQTIGALGAIAGAGWSDTVVATTRGASVLCLPTRVFREILDQDAHAATGMLRLVSKRLNEGRGRDIMTGRATPTGGGGGPIPN